VSRSELIDLLNQDLSREYQAIIGYVVNKFHLFGEPTACVRIASVTTTRVERTSLARSKRWPRVRPESVKQRRVPTQTIGSCRSRGSAACIIATS